MIAPAIPQHIQAMIDSPGIHFIHDPQFPNRAVPIFSLDFELISLAPDQPVPPWRLPTAVLIEGPVRSMDKRASIASRLPFQARIAILEELVRECHTEAAALPAALRERLADYLSQMQP